MRQRLQVLRARSERTRSTVRSTWLRCHWNGQPLMSQIACAHRNRSVPSGSGGTWRGSRPRAPRRASRGPMRPAGGPRAAVLVLEPPREVGAGVLGRVGRERLREAPGARSPCPLGRGSRAGRRRRGACRPRTRPCRAAEPVVPVCDPVREQGRERPELVNADRLDDHPPHLRARIRDPRAQDFDRLWLRIARGEKQDRAVATRPRRPGRFQQRRDKRRTFQCREFFGRSVDDLLAAPIVDHADGEQQVVQLVWDPQTCETRLIGGWPPSELCGRCWLYQRR
jgi:hypothetical protein